MIAFAFAALAAFGSANTSLAQDPCAGRAERTAYHMGTLLRVVACHADRDLALAAIEAGFAEVVRLERVLSSWRSDTEIGRVNVSPARTRVDLSPELAGLLTEAARWVEQTGGAFDPAVGALVDVWGFRHEAQVPSAARLAAALSLSGWHHASLRGGALARGPAGWWIDTGGFGKGAALRAFEAVLRARGVREALLDFGGQLLVIGEAEVRIAHPSQRDSATSSLRIRDASVATSSQSERYIESAGKRYGHILDPRSGLPVEPWGSVTVVASDALAADALATALFVMGPAAALAWAEEHPDVGVLVLEVELSAVRAAWNRAMTKWIEES